MRGLLEAMFGAWGGGDDSMWSTMYYGEPSTPFAAFGAAAEQMERARAARVAGQATPYQRQWRDADTLGMRMAGADFAGEWMETGAALNGVPGVARVNPLAAVGPIKDCYVSGAPIDGEEWVRRRRAHAERVKEARHKYARQKRHTNALTHTAVCRQMAARFFSGLRAQGVALDAAAVVFGKVPVGVGWVPAWMGSIGNRPHVILRGVKR